MDGRGKNGITNENSISIEMCVNIDGDETKTYINTIDLTRYLMQKYNIGLENVVRHYDASYKLCPHSWKQNNWEKWHKFKKDLTIDNNIDYTDYITNIYKKILRREPDAEGLNFWNQKLKTGTSKGEFLEQLTESEEFKNIETLH